MLGYFLLYSEVNEPYANLYPLLLGPPSYLTPIPPLCVITEHRAKLPVLSSSFPLAIYFTHGSVYMSVLLSWFIPSSSSPAASACVFSMSASLFLPWK